MRIMKTYHTKTCLGSIQCSNQKSLLPSDRAPQIRQPLWVLGLSHPFTDLSDQVSDFIIKRKKLHEDFIPIWDALLLELCRHEGLQGLAAESLGFLLCEDCGESSGTLLCTKCTIDAMFCPWCMCAKHHEQPLYWMQVHYWYRVCPVKINLKVHIAMDRFIFCHTFTGWCWSHHSAQARWAFLSKSES